MFKPLIACIGLLGAAAAQADNASGWYVGIGAGAMSYEIKDVDFNGDGPLVKIFGGYRFNPWVGLEVSALSSNVEDDAAFWDDFEIDTTAWTGEVVGTLPLRNGFAFFGKLGMASWEAEAKDHISHTSVKADGTDLVYGAGAQFDFKFPLRLRVEMEGIDVEDANVWGFTVGAAYRF